MITKFVATGDLHGRKNKPEYRTDESYLGTFIGKFSWVIQKANSINARLLIAGDIFDSSLCGTDVNNRILALFQTAKHTPYVVAGQHDLLYHTDLAKTPLYNLELAGAIKILQGEYEQFTGVSFEEEIPTEGNDFLIIHKTITPGAPPFFLPDAVAAKAFLRKNMRFKYIISGDYHPSHYTALKGSHLINVGTLMRNKKDMVDHVPTVWIIDTELDTVEPCVVPHKPFEEVFDMEAIAYSKEHGVEINIEKIQKLMDTETTSVLLDDIVWMVYKQFEEEHGAEFLSTSLIQEVLDTCK